MWCHPQAPAQVGPKPGLTQSLNFYQLGVPKQYAVLVDMPGYGFALANDKKIEAWNLLLRHYLENRPSLKRLFLLLDGRHGIKLIDREFMAYLDAHGPKYSCVLTKCDLVPPDV